MENMTPEEINALLNDWYKKTDSEKNNFNEEQKLKDRESVSRQSIAERTFQLWLGAEQKKEKWKSVLLYGFVGASFIQIAFIMGIVIADAFCNRFQISENVFISVILGTLAQIFGVIMVITRSLFDNRYDKIISFIETWIARK